MKSAPAQSLILKVFEALKVDEDSMVPCSFAFSKTKPIPGNWKCFSSDLAIPFGHIYAPGSKQSEIRRLSSGIRARVSIHLNFFYVYQTPVPADYRNDIANRIKQIAAHLRSPDERFTELAQAIGVPFGPLTMKERLEMTAELNALVARHCGLSREELVVILESFSSFEEDPELENLKEIKWSDTLMRKFIGEVRRRVMGYFDALEKSAYHEVGA
jgi:hypothetical protein